MKLEKSDRGFMFVMHKNYTDSDVTRVISESSAGPLGKYLWVGQNHLITRAEAKQLVKHLQRWIETGTLRLK
jgi:hypothetical protein